MLTEWANKIPHRFCTTENAPGFLLSLVSATPRLRNTPSIPAHSPDYVDERIAAFLAHFTEKLTSLSKPELDVVREALIRNKQCADVSLEEEVNRNWAEICSGEYVFDRLDREVSGTAEICWRGVVL